MSKPAGIIYVTVALYLEADVDEEEQQEILSEVDYEFKHPMISHTEIKEHHADTLERELADANEACLNFVENEQHLEAEINRLKAAALNKL